MKKTLFFLFPLFLFGCQRPNQLILENARLIDVQTGDIIAGRSLWRELELLNQAGLSPLEVLQTATLNPWQYLEKPTPFPLTEGAEANFIVLDKNPLEDINHLQSLSGIVYKGELKNEAGS